MTHSSRRTFESCALYCSTHPDMCVIFEFSNYTCSVSTTTTFFKYSKSGAEKTVWYNPSRAKVNIRTCEFHPFFRRLNTLHNVRMSDIIAIRPSQCTMHNTISVSSFSEFEELTNSISSTYFLSSTS